MSLLLFLVFFDPGFFFIDECFDARFAHEPRSSHFEFPCDDMEGESFSSTALDGVGERHAPIVFFSLGIAI